MHEIGKPVLDVLQGKQPKRMPIWLMRQAGRYLPEYRQLRADAGSFLKLCLTPSLATEITLQPIRRFDFDAAIIFADILLVPMALGKNLEFKTGEGPVLEPVVSLSDIETLHYDEAKVAAVFETVRRVKSQLPARTTLIGFCGSPWTVACYMIGGTSRNGFQEALQWAHEKPDALQILIDVITRASLKYLASQIDAGAEVIQLFDSWAGLLSGSDFDEWVIKPTKKLVAHLKEKYPDTPIIGFPREAKRKYQDYLLKTLIDAMSIDQGISLEDIELELRGLKPLQGNLDPQLLVKGGAEMKEVATDIMKKLGPRHIFNLGHGVVPETPTENVGELVEHVRSWTF